MQISAQILENLPLTGQQSAELVGVHHRSIRRFADIGRLPSVKGPGGQRRYRLADVVALRVERGAE